MSTTLGATSGYSYADASVGCRTHEDLTCPKHSRHSRTYMSLLIAGSIATDHLMSFGGKFADSLVVEQLDKLSVSFLVEDLDIRRGGCAGNICFGLAQLGLRPVLVGSAGQDFSDYSQLAGGARRRLRLGAHLRGPAHGPLRVHHRRHDGAVRQLLPRGDERGAADRAGPHRRARGGADLRAGRTGRPAGDGQPHPGVSSARLPRSSPTPASSWPSARAR